MDLHGLIELLGTDDGSDPGSDFDSDSNSVSASVSQDSTIDSIEHRQRLRVALEQFTEFTRSGLIIPSTEKITKPDLDEQLAVYEAMVKSVQERVARCNQMISLDFRGRIYKAQRDKLIRIPFFRLLLAEIGDKPVVSLDVSSNFIQYLEPLLDYWEFPVVTNLSDVPMILDSLTYLNMTPIIPTRHGYLITTSTILDETSTAASSDSHGTRYIPVEFLPHWLPINDIYGVTGGQSIKISIDTCGSYHVRFLDSYTTSDDYSVANIKLMAKPYSRPEPKLFSAEFDRDLSEKNTHLDD